MLQLSKKGRIWRRGTPCCEARDNKTIDPNFSAECEVKNSGQQCNAREAGLSRGLENGRSYTFIVADDVALIVLKSDVERTPY